MRFRQSLLNYAEKHGVTKAAIKYNVNRQYSTVQQLQQDFKAIGEVPSENDTEVWKSYQVAVERFYDLLKMNKELRDYDFKKNLEQKQALCAEAEALDEEADIVDAFKKLQQLHTSWREIGPVSKEIREELWTRFKNASAVINKKYQWIKTIKNIIIYFSSCFYLLIFIRRGGTVFQTAAPFMDYNPETSSRVTLASLGIAFQANLAEKTIRFICEIRGQTKIIHNAQSAEIRRNPSARQAHTIRCNRMKIRERTNPLHPCYPCFFLNACARR